jgi:replicative DNA helicase
VNLENREAEAGVISAAILRPALMLDLVRVLDVADFADPHHRVFWRALTSLAGREFDVVEVRHAIDREGHLTDRVRERLSEIEAGSISANNADAHARIVADLAIRRRLQDAAVTIAKIAHEVPDTATLIGEAEAAVLGAGRLARSAEPRSMREALQRYLAEQQRAMDESGLYGVPTGLPTFDRRYRGLRPGQVVVIAARPGAGKSTLALQIAMHAARQGRRTLVFSLEMRAEEIAPRALSHDLRVPEDDALDRLRQDERFMREYMRAAELVSDLAIDIDDGVSSTMPEIRAQLRRHQVRKSDLGLVVVDYLQLIHSGRKRSENREAELAEVSRGLKLAAIESGLPVIVVAQLNRESEREKRAPRLSDLRGSGAIEADADMVLFIHRSDDKDPDDRHGGAIAVELQIAKARKGPIGTIDATFFTAWSQFREAVTA